MADRMSVRILGTRATINKSLLAAFCYSVLLSAVASAEEPPADPARFGLPPSVGREDVQARTLRHKTWVDGRRKTSTFETGPMHRFVPGRGLVDFDDAFTREGNDDVMRTWVETRISDQGVSATMGGKGVRWLVPIRPVVTGREAQYVDGGITWTYTANPERGEARGPGDRTSGRSYLRLQVRTDWWPCSFGPRR